MIRVGFLLDFINHRSLGGLNYLSNLIHSVLRLPDRQIEPVLLAGRHAPPALLESLPQVEIVRSPLLDQGDPRFILRKACQLLSRQDAFAPRLLMEHRVDVLSHSGYLGPNSRIPTIGWIPDFQHRYFPHLFSKWKLALREVRYRRICRYCSCVLLSSFTARNDLQDFSPDHLRKSRVLQFVSGLGGYPNLVERVDLEARYGFEGAYFHVPNQWWAHKNHAVILNALRILKSQGRKILVISTGNTHDNRQPDHFEIMMRHARAHELLDSLKVLGIVPYLDVLSFMKHSVSIINPSLFEGWSTSVEEAKSMGKRIILSDIPVHREQAPERGEFFDPGSAKALAEILWRKWSSLAPEKEEEHAIRARRENPRRLHEFARSYEDIVIEVSRQESAKSLARAGPQQPEPGREAPCQPVHSP